jgi:hypothetical protein
MSLTKGLLEVRALAKLLVLLIVWTLHPKTAMKEGLKGLILKGLGSQGFQ